MWGNDSTTANAQTLENGEIWLPSLAFRWRIIVSNDIPTADGDGGTFYPDHEVGRVLEQLWTSSNGGREYRPIPEFIPPADLNQLANMIRTELAWDRKWNVAVENDTIIVEEDYEMGEDEKNDDDCVDCANENGIEITKMFPQLEIADAYCHRHKYSIVNLKLKVNGSST